MARASSKKIAASNASTIRVLTYGFLLTNVIHLLFVFGPLQRFSGSHGQTLASRLFKFVATELIAGGLAVVLRGMARQGDDLAQEGLTAYMFDIVYITWFVHVTTAVFSSRFWWTYLVIPVYATYFGYSKLVVPFLLGGRDPLKGVFGLFSGVASPGGSPGSAGQAGAAAGQPEMSKRQAKLQKRAERGDPRVAQQQQQARRR